VTKPIEGGSAFPHGPGGMSMTCPDGYTHHQLPGSQGMSLRQWYIGQALAGLCANPVLAQYSISEVVGKAISRADALMTLLSDESKEPKP
jgi:hypothetical protein